MDSLPRTEHRVHLLTRRIGQDTVGVLHPDNPSPPSPAEGTMNVDTDITVILDRSGSMGNIASDVIVGFNAFLAAQRRETGVCRLTLVQFDDQYEVVCDALAIAEVPQLSKENFQPRGTTALLDAIGRTVENTGARLRALSESERPGRVLVAIITDGLENASTDYTRERVFDMISTQRDRYQWTFLFFAANQDAIAEGARIGIGADQSLNVGPGGAGFRAATLAMSTAVSAFRATGETALSSDEVKKKRKKKVH